jgi:hypothetical protein
VIVGGPRRNQSQVDAARLREADAVEMRRRGETYDRIAAALGYSDRSSARRAVQRALAARAKETTTDRDALIGEQIANLDTVLEGLLPKAAKGDARAAEVVLKALDRHARLFGIDAPVRIKAELTDERIARVMQLAEQLADAGGAE